MSGRKLPWDEWLDTLSINPDAATRDDVARMASELSECRDLLRRIRERAEDVLSTAEGGADV